jgi:hypothetical protein
MLILISLNFLLKRLEYSLLVSDSRLQLEVIRISTLYLFGQLSYRLLVHFDFFLLTSNLLALRFLLLNLKFETL